MEFKFIVDVVVDDDQGGYLEAKEIIVNEMTMLQLKDALDSLED